MQRDDTPAALGMERGIGKIQRAPDAGILLRSDGLGADLSREVELDTGVHGDHIVILHDDGRVVHIGTGHHAAVGDAAEGVVQFQVAPVERSDMHADIDLLALSGRDAAADHLPHRGGIHLRVDAEVMQIHHLRREGVRELADAELDAVAVPHEAAAVLGDLFVDLVGLLVLHGVDGVVALVQGDAQAPRHHGHIGVHLQNHPVGGGEKLPLPQHGKAHAEAAALVHGGHGGGEYRHGARFPAESSEVTQIRRDVADIPLGMPQEPVRAVEEARRVDMSVHIVRRHKIVMPVRADEHRHILHPGRDGVQPPEQRPRLVAVPGHADGIS